MSAHRNVNVLLYDYLKNEISAVERAAIEKHLVLCKECRADIEKIRSVIQLLPHNSTLPGDERPAEYWQRFSDTVDDRLKKTPSSTIQFWTNVWDDIISFVMLRPVAVSAVSAVVALVIVTGVLWQSGM